MIKHLLLAVIALTITQQTLACGEVKPNKKITKIVTRLAYNDFPRASDIFSIIRIESSFVKDAANITERESSIGLMQVQEGSFEPRENIAQGIALLREYYMLTGSVEGAVKSYNIGPRNFLRGKFKLSGEAYYRKFLLQKKVYAHYPDKVTYLGKTLGCGQENGIPDWLKLALVKDAPEELVVNAMKQLDAHARLVRKKKKLAAEGNYE